MEYDADIFDAVEFGDLETIQTFWTEEINIDYQDTLGWTLIMLATKYSFRDIVDYLLTFNPNLYLINNDGQTVFSIAEQLEDETIYKRMVSCSWKDNERMFLLVLHVKPNFKTDDLGAYVNSWIMDESFNSARERSIRLIEAENWKIQNIEDVLEIEKGEIEEDDEKFEYYEQVIIDKQVLVFYTYDNEYQ